jgi:hypothetical protein
MTGTPLTVSPMEVQTIGYPWTYYQFFVTFGCRMSREGKGEGERGGTHEIGSSVNWAHCQLNTSYSTTKRNLLD